ncbi:glycosyltransferase family 4 protein [Thalassotalea sp. M1531]|uniref:Glycosyltransferase family 4 protein n=1 Tax=Thalassotalea algicola TaxID=2716224 RepID=A0A7Y0LEU1_9GAMM|nr:glycosyltransferase family 4 protein [Thalassotalea algicola]NMP32963.1 glycosyltransferase family 4 protein [Thalassotalea algicola]
MHILFLTDNFPPEGNAPATRTFEHAREWVKEGHKVTVITCAPNFPEGRVFEGYKNSLYSRSNMDGIDVVRVKTFISSNEGFVLRILDFISFMFSSFLAGLLQRKVDVIVATSPQFFTAVSGWALSTVKRKKFVFELRDIWPASITAVGAMKDSWAIKILEKLEMFLYRRADSIISVTKSFKQELIERGIDGGKISVVLNGVDLSKYQLQRKKDKYFSEKYKLENKFVVGYIGTHGLAHALEHVIEAAELLQADENIRFLFAGGGAAKDKLVKLVDEKQLTNVVFIARQPKESMPSIWSLCDVSLISLRDTPLFKTVIPSKIFESMGMGLPMLAPIPKGEASEIIELANAGIICSPENGDTLAEKVVELISSEKLLHQYQQNSLAAAAQFDRKQMASLMLDVVERLTK